MTNGFTININNYGWMMYASNIYYTNILRPDDKISSDNKRVIMWYNNQCIYKIFPNVNDDNVNSNVVITPEKYYVPGGDHSGISLLWLAYAATEDVNSEDMPLPWAGPKNSSLAYGFRWGIKYRGKYIDECEIYRDNKYDKGNITNELLRPEIIYPRNINEYNNRKSHYKSREACKDGYKVATYVCTAWTNINNVSIPMKSEFKAKSVGFKEYPYNFQISKLNAEKVQIYSNDLKIKDITNNIRSNKVYVRDYRYRKLEGKHLYRRAEYTLEPGEPWKGANDPEILAERAEYLESGPEYDEYVTYPHYVSWITMGLIITTPAVIYLIWRRRRRYE
ncbi:MAG: hypothetical protein K9N52_03130 [Verrucomicrobia bacterium]|nr:hypothetical protein [Verrucomicrobiota bacterium]